jgi:hypothetical protein
VQFIAVLFDLFLNVFQTVRLDEEMTVGEVSDNETVARLFSFVQSFDNLFELNVTARRGVSNRCLLLARGGEKKWGMIGKDLTTLAGSLELRRPFARLKITGERLKGCVSRALGAEILAF